MEDRAWVCAKILEQLRFDSVVLRTQPNSKGTSDAWLLGVVIDRQIALFDLRLGLPVTNDTSDGGVATLSEVVLHPEWLERMSANEPV